MLDFFIIILVYKSKNYCERHYGFKNLEASFFFLCLF